jgi:hypothetical protein
VFRTSQWPLVDREDVLALSHAVGLETELAGLERDSRPTARQSATSAGCSTTLPWRRLAFDGLTGAPKADFVVAGSGGLTYPMGMAFGPDGNLYVSSQTDGDILRYDGITGVFLGVFASGGGMVQPEFLVFGP